MIRSTRLLVIVGFLLGFVRLTAAETKMSDDMKLEIVSSYVKVSSALAADDLAAAKKAAGEVAEHAKMSSGYKAIAPKADAIAKAGNIDAARDAFKSLSSAVEPLAKGASKYVAMHCPMAGDWIQEKGSTKNPYMGKAMLTCGGPKETK